MGSSWVVEILPSGLQALPLFFVPQVLEGGTDGTTVPLQVVEQRTTESATSTCVNVGERLPDSVEIRSFPDKIYRESPSLREYRYIERDNRTYVVEPRERTIIEEID
jgi:hypothetical protein